MIFCCNRPRAWPTAASISTSNSKTIRTSWWVPIRYWIKHAKLILKNQYRIVISRQETTVDPEAQGLRFSKIFIWKINWRKVQGLWGESQGTKLTRWPSILSRIANQWFKISPKSECEIAEAYIKALILIQMKIKTRIHYIRQHKTFMVQITKAIKARHWQKQKIDYE